MHRWKGYAALGILAAMAILGSGCRLAGETGGRVIDARDGGYHADGVEGVQIRLSGAGGTYETESGSDGAWYLPEARSGIYSVTAWKDGWYFPPMEVSVNGWGYGDIDISGVYLPEVEQSSLNFLLVWESSDDLDLVMTFPQEDYSTGQILATPHTGGSGVSYWYEGFGTGSSNRRIEIDRFSPYHDSAYLSRHETDRGPETMTLKRIPFSYQPAWWGGDPWNIVPDSSNGLLGLFTGSDDLEYRWMGVAQLYVRGLPSDPAAAGAVVHAFQKTSGNSARSLGSYRIQGHNSGTSSVIRINLLHTDSGYQAYQLVSDLSLAVSSALAPGSAIRSAVSGASAAGEQEAE